MQKTIFVTLRKWSNLVVVLNDLLKSSYGIRPEKLPPAENIKKLERRVKSDEKKLEKQSGRLPKVEPGEQTE
jgi:hypothetical protein